jgi:hypothetical protein
MTNAINIVRLDPLDSAGALPWQDAVGHQCSSCHALDPAPHDHLPVNSGQRTAVKVIRVAVMMVVCPVRGSIARIEAGDPFPCRPERSDDAAANFLTLR